jgi:hypothetical protein
MLNISIEVGAAGAYMWFWFLLHATLAINTGSISDPGDALEDTDPDCTLKNMNLPYLNCLKWLFRFTNKAY